ncbi:hypothetical protein BKA62DRAFT_342724 [Auriculariales sp. MPI-PUGE-AT-0066]|nr:hypothetical protein BKA62DRAFT_342724 [Auriculariales sp. MPI-PUGE-AT-0066]
MLLLPLSLLGAFSVGWRETGDCQLRAWVRAGDLVQNGLSHGELRVMLKEPCDADITKVGLKLRLDEFSETSQIERDVSDVNAENPDWLWGKNFNKSAIDGTTVLRNRNAFEVETDWQVEDAAGASLKSSQGLVLPFSILMPNVRFPTGIFPLSFACHWQTDGKIFSPGDSTLQLGRAYRYIAFVEYANGTQEASAAGFTTFIPTPKSKAPLIPYNKHTSDRNAAVDMKSPSPESRTFEVALKSDERMNRRRKKKTKKAWECPPDESPSTLTLNITFPRGSVAVPGQQLPVLVSLMQDPNDSDHLDSETRINFHLTLVLEPNLGLNAKSPLVALEAPAYPGDSPTTANNVQAAPPRCIPDMLSTLQSPVLPEREFDLLSAVLETCKPGEPTLFHLHVPKDIPLASASALFESSVRVSVTASRKRRVSVAPLNAVVSPWSVWSSESRNTLPEDYAEYDDGANGAWAYDSCAKQRAQSQRFQGFVDLQLWPEHDEGQHYLDIKLPQAADHSDNPTITQFGPLSPALISGHYQNREEITLEKIGRTTIFGTAIARTEERVAKGVRGWTLVDASVNDIEGFVGHYVGPLWREHELGIERLKRIPVVPDPDGETEEDSEDDLYIEWDDMGFSSGIHDKGQQPKAANGTAKQTEQTETTTEGIEMAPDALQHVLTV